MISPRFALVAGALLAFLSPAHAVDVVVNGQFSAGLASWTAAPSTTGSQSGTCGFNAVVSPGNETLTGTAGFPALGASTAATSLGSMSIAANGFKSCVLYQDVAIPAGALTASLSFTSGTKLVGGLPSGDTAIFAGLYPTTSVPNFNTDAAIAGTRLIIGGATFGPAMGQRGPQVINVSSVAGTTVRLAIINAMQSTSSGTGPPIAGANAVIGIGDVVLDVVVPTTTSFTGPTATGSGMATVSFTGGGAGCTFAAPGNGPLESAFFIPVSGHPKSPPNGSAPALVNFPHGLLDFVLQGCTPGSAVSFTVTYPVALRAGTSYWKYGPTPGTPAPHWYILPSVVAGNVATFTITDGALGDDDLVANGNVVDQGGPGLAAAPGSGIPTLSEWMLILLAALVVLGGTLGIRAGKRANAAN